jgi:hypothetical protein
LNWCTKDEVAAPSIQSTQLELVADINTDKSLGSAKLARTDAVVE